MRSGWVVGQGWASWRLAEVAVDVAGVVSAGSSPGGPRGAARLELLSRGWGMRVIWGSARAKNLCWSAAADL